MLKLARWEKGRTRTSKSEGRRGRKWEGEVLV
jgi:hypothetical protein